MRISRLSLSHSPKSAPRAHSSFRAGQLSPLWAGAYDQACALLPTTSLSTAGGRQETEISRFIRTLTASTTAIIECQLSLQCNLSSRANPKQPLRHPERPSQNILPFAYPHLGKLYALFTSPLRRRLLKQISVASLVCRPIDRLRPCRFTPPITTRIQMPTMSMSAAS